MAAPGTPPVGESFEIRNTRREEGGAGSLRGARTPEKPKIGKKRYTTHAARFRANSDGSPTACTARYLRGSRGLAGGCGPNEGDVLDHVPGGSVHGERANL